MKEYVIRTDAELRVENGRLIAVHDGSGVRVDMFREMPPHGRLIDADALQYYIVDLAENTNYVFDAVGCHGLVGSRPTILEASK